MAAFERYTFKLRIRIRITRPGPARTVPDAAGRAGKSDFGASSRVALGILGSRITGLFRERLVAHYFGGATAVADVLRAAIRIPNLLNNLFGEGVLSASFVTVYSKLLASGHDEEADDLAASVFGILAAVCSVLVVAGVLVAPLLSELIAPGFEGKRRALTISVVRILFPGTGLLVMSAWCLGVLNSHRRFLLSYLAPVAQNLTVIAALILLGTHYAQNTLLLFFAWATVLGSALQFLVQLPRVLKLLPSFKPTLDTHSESIRTVMKNFGPVFLSRGVVQISAYVDSMIASFLPTGAVGILGYAQVISVLPVSLFSMSVSAAELPTMSSAVGTQEEMASFLRGRLTGGLRRIAFFVVPSAVAFLVHGDVIAAALYQSGQFHYSDAADVWAVLAGSAVGLLATSLGRLYSSAFYALLDTRTPLRFAIARVGLTIALGYLFALPLPRWLGIDPKWGVAGLTASAGIAGWVEFLLLRRGLGLRIGSVAIPRNFLLKLWTVALISAAFLFPIKGLTGPGHPQILALLVLPLYGAMYFGGTMALGVEESRSAVRMLMRRARIG